MHKPATLFAAIIFALVAIAHLLRLIFGLAIVVAGWPVPMWISIIGCIVPGGLAVALWQERRTVG